MAKGTRMRNAAPASETVQGPVKQAATTAALAGGADLPTTVAKVNDVIAKLKAAGLMA